MLRVAARGAIRWCSRLALRSKASPRKRTAERTMLRDSQMDRCQMAVPSLFGQRRQHSGHGDCAVNRERLLWPSLNLCLSAQLINALP